MARSERASVRRRGSGDRGASAVEFALVVPFLLLIIFGIISFGMMLSFRQTLSQAATEGARAAAVQLDQSDTNVWSQASTAISADMGSVKIGGQTLACGASSGATSITHVTCTVSAAVACGTATCRTVTVTYPYKANPIIPSVPLVSFILPTNLTYSATVRVS